MRYSFFLIIFFTTFTADFNQSRFCSFLYFLKKEECIQSAMYGGGLSASLYLLSKTNIPLVKKIKDTSLFKKKSIIIVPGLAAAFVSLYCKIYSKVEE
jgi:hypothetical protein